MSGAADQSTTEFASNMMVALEGAVAAIRSISPGEFPSISRESNWWATQSDGTGSGVQRRTETIDLSGVLHAWSEEIDRGGTVDEVQAYLRDYLRQLAPNLKPPMETMFIPVAAGNLISRYLTQIGRASWDPNIAAAEISVLDEYMHSTETESRATWLVDDFSAESTFKLGDQIELRPISEAELIEYGVSPEGISAWSPHMTYVPWDKWWVISATGKGPKNSFVASNSSRRVNDVVIPALRLLKGGRFSVRLAGETASNPYGQFGQHSASDWTVGARRGDAYCLTTSEIGELSDRWSELNTVLSAKDHYLQTSLNRLMDAGERLSYEDAIVDCVIGLESLLGERSGEITFKVSMRGALIIGDDVDDRRKWRQIIEDLYRLRSDIVHEGAAKGKSLQGEAIGEWLARAEDALRKVWWWFFTNHRDSGGGGDGKGSLNSAMLGGELPR